MNLHIVHIYFWVTHWKWALYLVYCQEENIGTGFDKFRYKPKGYTERKFNNPKYVMHVVTDMEDMIKTS